MGRVVARVRFAVAAACLTGCADTAVVDQEARARAAAVSVHFAVLHAGAVVARRARRGRRDIDRSVARACTRWMEPSESARSIIAARELAQIWWPGLHPAVRASTSDLAGPTRGAGTRLQVRVVARPRRASSIRRWHAETSHVNEASVVTRLHAFGASLATSAPASSPLPFELHATQTSASAIRRNIA